MISPNDPAFPVDPETQKYQTASAGWLLAGITTVVAKKRSIQKYEITRFIP